jgi:hypothetical protein
MSGKASAQRRDRIEASIAWRTGGALERGPIYVPRETLTGHKGPESLMALDTGRPTFLPLNDGEKRVPHRDGGFVPQNPVNLLRRHARMANHICREGIQSVFLLNLLDAEHHDYGAYEEEWAGVPVFQYCRPCNTLGAAILVSLGRWYMGPGSPNLPAPGFDEIPFDAKVPKAVWRGAPTGTRVVEGRKVPLRNRIQEALKSPEAAERMFAGELRHYQRVSTLLAARTMPRVDAQFVTGEGEAFPEGPEPIRALFGERLSRAEQLRYRYLLALEGADAPTSLYWGLASNSVVLCGPRNWETIMDEGLRPWEHWVPIAGDGHDIEERIDWCESHPDRCREIVANANAAMSWLNDREQRDIVDHEVWRRYAMAAYGLHRVTSSLYAD